jgi:hypothetical protein
MNANISDRNKGKRIRTRKIKVKSFKVFQIVLTTSIKMGNDNATIG